MPAARAGGPGQSVPAYDVFKVRILLKLQDRLDPAKVKRMPESLLRQTARVTAEQLVEAECGRMNKSDRDRMVEEVLAEAFGFGPLDEFFADPHVREVLVLGTQAVLVRKDSGWVPTNVRFKDADHLQEILEKVNTYGDSASGTLPLSAMDTRLPNGFRAVAVIPPPAVEQAPMAVFVRAEPPTPAANGSVLSASGVAAVMHRPLPTGSTLIAHPVARHGPEATLDHPSRPPSHSHYRANHHKAGEFGCLRLVARGNWRAAKSCCGICAGVLRDGARAANGYRSRKVNSRDFDGDESVI